jgi:hypothetical protein
VQKAWSRISQAWAPLNNRAAAKFPIDILFYKKGLYSVTVFSSVVDPAPYRSALNLVGWIRIQLGKNNHKNRKKGISLLDVLF